MNAMDCSSEQYLRVLNDGWLDGMLFLLGLVLDEVNLWLAWCSWCDLWQVDVFRSLWFLDQNVYQSLFFVQLLLLEDLSAVRWGRWSLDEDDLVVLLWLDSLSVASCVDLLMIWWWHVNVDVLLDKGRLLNWSWLWVDWSWLRVDWSWGWVRVSWSWGSLRVSLSWCGIRDSRGSWSRVRYLWCAVVGWWYRVWGGWCLQSQAQARAYTFNWNENKKTLKTQFTTWTLAPGNPFGGIHTWCLTNIPDDEAEA